MDWKDRAKQLRFVDGLSWGKIAETIQSEYMQNDTTTTVLERVRGYLRNTPEYKGSATTDKPKDDTPLITHLKSPKTAEELKTITGMSERVIQASIEDLREQGYQIEHDAGKYFVSKLSDIGCEENNHIEKWNGDKVIRFGLMGDTQINSKYAQLTHLHALYGVYKSEGIETVYHTGDIDEGEEMRIGHKYECYEQGADDHIKEICRVYPKHDGIVTKFITGNHDHSIIKRAGFDIGYAIQNKRNDLQYLGQSYSNIQLTPNCRLELRHPIDGTAYALSYKMQKMIEAFSGGDKPNILAVGHYHKSEYMFYRNVHSFQTGCFQSQTPFTRGKGISIQMGGWIVECHVSDDGTITRIKQEFIPFYHEIKDDYLNWR